MMPGIGLAYEPSRLTTVRIADDRQKKNFQGRLSVRIADDRQKKNFQGRLSVPPLEFGQRTSPLKAFLFLASGLLSACTANMGYTPNGHSGHRTSQEYLTSDAQLGNITFVCREKNGKAKSKESPNAKRDFTTVPMNKPGTSCNAVKATVKKELIEKLKYNPKILERLRHLPGGLQIQILQTRFFDGSTVGRARCGIDLFGKVDPGTFRIQLAGKTLLGQDLAYSDVLMHEVAHVLDCLSTLDHYRYTLPFPYRDGLLPDLPLQDRKKFLLERRKAEQMIRNTRFPPRNNSEKLTPEQRDRLTTEQRMQMVLDGKASPLADFDALGPHSKHYALTNQQEFMSVLVERYFQMPELLKLAHPELYRIMDDYFLYHKNKLSPANENRGTSQNPFTSKQTPPSNKPAAPPVKSQ